MNKTVDWNPPFLGRDQVCGPELHNVQRQRERALGPLVSCLQYWQFQAQGQKGKAGPQWVTM